MKRSWCVTVLLLVISLPCRAEVFKLNFEDIPALVRERNDHTKGAQLFTESSKARTGFLGRSYLPTLKGGAGGEYFVTGELESPQTQPFAEVTTEINLFHGGRDYLQDREHQLQYNASKSRVDAAYFEELAKARKEFWNLVYRREVEAFFTEALERNAQSLGAANRRLKAGLGTETDRMEFEIRRSTLEQDRARNQGESRRSQRVLNALLAQNLEIEIETASQVSHEHFDDILSRELDLEQHYEVKTLQAQSAISNTAARKEALWWAPRLDLYGTYLLSTLREREFAEIEDRQDLAAGVKISMNIFDGGNSFRESKALRAQSRAIEMQSSQTRRELISAFQSAKDDLKVTHDLIDSAEVNIEQARAYLKATLSEYARGLKNSPDALGAHQRYFETISRWAELKRDYQYAKTNLLLILGE